MKKPRLCLSIGKQDPAFDEMVETLSPFADVTVVGLDGFSLAGYDIFVGKKLSREALRDADALKAVFAYKTGVDDFPLDAFKERGIALYNSHADGKIIAEYAVSLAVGLATRICEFDRKLRQGIWYDTDNRYWKSIFTMSVGLLGYGHIGKGIHAILKQNGIPVYTLDRGKGYKDIGLCKTVEELADTCDILILSLPKTAATDHIVDEALLSRMKGKFIVNVGRSNAIDQEALYQALVSEHLAGAAIDTWDAKPKQETDRLMPSRYRFEELDNVILSPHAAMRVEEGHENYVEDVTENILRYINGDAPTNGVDLTRGY